MLLLIYWLGVYPSRLFDAEDLVESTSSLIYLILGELGAVVELRILLLKMDLLEVLK